MVSSDLAGLLAAIKASPAEDTPRLVLADYLREHGQEDRGEFIAVQVELAARGSHDVSTRGLGLKQCCGCGRGQICERCIELRRRERELLKNHWCQWVAPSAWSFLAQEPDGFHRGFISKVVAHWHDWSRLGDSILADPWVPGLDEVELTTWPELDVTRNSTRGFYTLTVRGLERYPYIVSDMELENIRSTAIFRSEAVFHAARHRWHYDGKPAVRAWKLPPEPRARQLNTRTNVAIAPGAEFRPGDPVYLREDGLAYNEPPGQLLGEAAPQNEWPADYEDRDFTDLFPGGRDE